MTLWFAFILVACNLGTAPAAQPPTLAPRNTAEPVATLGYSGSGNQVVEVASDISAPVASIDVELFNLTEQVDVGRLRTHVETLESFTTRHVNSTQTRTDYGIGAASTYIYNQFLDIQTNSQGRFTAQSLPFDMQYAGSPTRQENIVGVLQGTMPGAGFIIVGAHYDSINTDFEDATGFAPGANDNGSGVAGLIEMARVMSQRQYRSSIIFVAFSAEEVGRLGSKAFVTWTQQQGIVDVAGMINIDSIGNSNNRSGEVNESLRIFSCEEESICRDDGLSRHMARSMEFLGFAFLDNYLEQFHFTIKESAKCIQSHFGAAVIFGIFTSILLHIPILGPIAVPFICGIAATRYGHRFRMETFSIPKTELAT